MKYIAAPFKKIIQGTLRTLGYQLVKADSTSLPAKEMLLTKDIDALLRDVIAESISENRIDFSLTEKVDLSQSL